MIRLAKKSETDKQQKIVDNANAQIKIAQRVQAANDYLASRYEDGLKTIDDQANEITKKYDKQFESLDKISKINETIARQEKGRLSVSEALSQGDVYAAARAAQELRAQNAADAAAFAKSSLNSFNITIQAGVGDPNAIAEALDQYLQGAVDRGTLRLR